MPVLVSTFLLAVFPVFVVVVVVDGDDLFGSSLLLVGVVERREGEPRARCGSVVSSAETNLSIRSEELFQARR